MASNHKAELSGDETVVAGRKHHNTRGRGGHGGHGGRGRGRAGRRGTRGPGRGNSWSDAHRSGGVRIDANPETSHGHGRGARGSERRRGGNGQRRNPPIHRVDQGLFTSLRSSHNIAGPSAYPAPIDQRPIHDPIPASRSVRREQCLPPKFAHPRLQQATRHPQTLHRTSIEFDPTQSQHPRAAKNRRQRTRNKMTTSVPPHLRKSMQEEPSIPAPKKNIPPHLRIKKPTTPKSIAPHLRPKKGPATNTKTEATGSSTSGVPLNNVTTPPPSTGRVERGIWIGVWVPDEPEPSPAQHTAEQSSRPEQHSTSAKVATSVFSEPQLDNSSVQIQDTAGTSPVVLNSDKPEVAHSLSSKSSDVHIITPANETPMTPTPIPTPQGMAPAVSFQQWIKEKQKESFEPVKPEKKTVWRHSLINPRKKPRSKPSPPPKQNDRSSRWPKNSEMRVRSHKSEDFEFDPEPARLLHWDGEEGVALDTDENDPIRLLDWEGNWLPAPIEWEGRKGFRHANFYEWMGGWRLQTVASSRREDGRFDMNLPEEEFLDPDSDIIAPRLWVPKVIDEQSPQTFWAAFQMARPEPIWEEDIAYKPWWLTYVNAESNFILPPITKEEKGVNPNEAQDKPSFGSNAVEALRQKEDADREIHFRKSVRKEQRKRQLKQNMAELAENQEPVIKAIKERELKPEVNLYVRPVRPGDMTQITEIYNWHRQNSILPPEGSPVNLTNMIARMRDIVDNNAFPFIVAVEKTAPKKPRPGQFVLTERIAGFAYVDDYHTRNGMYKYSCELELYVRHDLRKKAVGSCLLDKLIACVDPFYDEKLGYEWRCENSERTKYERGGRRMTGKVIVHLGYFDGDTDILGWASQWLERFGFAQASNMQKFGCKFQRFTGLATYVYTTGYMYKGVLQPNLDCL